MIAAYDMEHMHIAVDALIAAVQQMQTHSVQYNIGWRLSHMLRELGEFRLALWGDRLPTVKTKED